MNKKLLKIAAVAAVSIPTMAFFACGDSGSSVNSANNAVGYSSNSIASSASTISSSANTSSSEANVAASLTGVWHYYIGGENADIKWGSNPDVAPIPASYAVDDGFPVNEYILASCNGGICGKVTLKPSVGDEWNALLLMYVLQPDDWAEGIDVSALPGVCLKYNVVYSGDAIEFENNLQVMNVNLEVSDNLAVIRDYNAKFRYSADENLVTGNKGETRVLNLAWSDFVWPPSDTFFASASYTLEESVAHLHAIQIRLAQYEEHDVTVLFNIQKVGVYGTCAD